jgi:hypothetical protein
MIRLFRKHVSSFCLVIHNLCIVNDDEITRKDNIFRFLEDYPDFDFQVIIVATDGLVVVL